MSKYTLEEQKRQKWNTELFQADASQVLDLASGGNRDIEMDNPANYGMIMVIKLSSEVGTAGITPQLYIKDEDGNKIVIRSEAALTANGTYTYVYAPGASTGGYNGADVTAAVDLHLPKEFGIRLNKSTGDTGQTFTEEILVAFLN